MENSDLEKLRYPIGKFITPAVYPDAYLEDRIQSIASFPERLKKAVSDLSEVQLNTPYRPEGWSLRQVVHHCADSHMNCLVRIKWTLTEHQPIIKYYFEDRWSALHDNATMPIAPTLQLLEGLHYRLVYILQNLSSEDLEKSFIHPEHQKEFTLKEIIGLYAWHGDHHLAQITSLLERKGW